MLINTETLTALDTMVSTAFAQGVSKADPAFDEIVMLAPSGSRSNSYVWLGAMSGMREWVGDRVVDQLSGHTYTVENKSYEKTISILREDIEDDQYGVYANVAEELGLAVKTHKSKLVWELLAAGESQNGYDGVPFFSDNHPSDGGVQSNLIAGAAAPFYVMDLSRKVKPLIFQTRKEVELVSKTNPEDHNVFWSKKFIWGADGRYAAGFGLWQMAVKSKAALTETTLNAARAKMRGITDDAGDPAGFMPTTLVVGISNETAAEKLVKSLNLANGESNINYGKYKLIVSPYLP